VPAAPVPCLVAPTGSGKTEVAIDVARRTRGEVVACDAYGVYRGMEILTAAPLAPPDVPHHLVGCLDPADTWSAARFVEAADHLVDAIRARGRQPWIVGGTALYLRAWLKGFDAAVPRDAAFREDLRAVAARDGPETLHERLAALDPRRAAALHPHDLRRVIRALEIVRATGQPASQQRTRWDRPDRVAAVVLGLRRDLDDLDRRIEARVRAMFEAGVVEEARRLLEQPLSPEARRVLGLDELERLLAGAIEQDAAIEGIAARTRRLARKQRTFFASFPSLRWIDVGPDEATTTIADRVLAALADQAAGTSS
jgi:tRNA dimethylallyltransferase